MFLVLFNKCRAKTTDNRGWQTDHRQQTTVEDGGDKFQFGFALGQTAREEETLHFLLYYKFRP